MIRWWRC